MSALSNNGQNVAVPRMSALCHEQTSWVQVAQRKAARRRPLKRAFLARYCSPTSTENAPFAPLA